MKRTIMLLCALLCLYSLAAAQTQTVGTTWYDLQQQGGGGRLICLEPNGNIHVTWTYECPIGPAGRHIFYNLYYPSSGWVFAPNGTQVESSVRAGYSSIGVNSEGRPFIGYDALHCDGHYYPEVATDFIPGFSAFQFWATPWTMPPWNRHIFCPRITVDRQGYIQLISFENTGSGFPNDLGRLLYCRGYFTINPFEINYIDFVELDSTLTISGDIAASRHSDRVAIIYAKPLCDSTIACGNDIYLIVSEDGINWNLNDTINVTNFIPPDSIGMGADTLRFNDELSLLFDADDNIHVAFSTLSNRVAGNAMIWHWSDATEYYSLVAQAWWAEYPSYYQQDFLEDPCVAVDESTGDLFITYRLNDTTEVAANGFLQGDIFASRSTTNGVYWSVGTNITNTHAPGAEPGFSLSERDITCNETVQNDILHLLYTLDTDAGSFPWMEGTSTECPVLCRWAPINQIPAYPLMPQYPFHVEHASVPLAQSRSLPGEFHLSQNYPNPFNASTTLRYTIPQPAQVTLEIYNILGQSVVSLYDGKQQPGTHTIAWNAENLPSGIYFAQLKCQHHLKTIKMLLIK